MPRSFEGHRFKKTGDHEYVCVTDSSATVRTSASKHLAAS